jgi:hypothetical protein
MRGHGLGVLERAAGLEVRRDAGRPEHVAAELDLEPGFGRAPADHAIGVDPVHRLVGQHACFANRRAEEGGLAVAADPGRGKVLVDEGLQLVMRRQSNSLRIAARCCLTVGLAASCCFAAGLPAAETCSVSI